MRTSALILLLLAMLAPRLSAALPHALACAGQGGTAVAMQTGDGDPHAEHTKISGHHGGHAEHSSHHSAMTAADPVDADATEASGDCQHCGQCDEHCSAVVLTALPQQQASPGAEHLVSANAGQRAGFSHDLNRPPRTSSL
ncbi:MAG: hypothetical protein ACK4E7_14120 [Permianibacter sp.]